jgi:flagellar hook-associated protein 2
VSADLQELAAALMARQREPIKILEIRRTELNTRSSAIGTLRTRLTALRSALDALNAPGTLSPFSAKTATSSEPTLVGATAAPNAPAGALAVNVVQLAKRSTHMSDVLSDAGTTISGAGAGTFTFTLTIAGTTHDVSVEVAAGDTDAAVLDKIATAVATATGGAASSFRIQTTPGSSRLSIGSASTGTSNKIVFGDTDGLLARLGVVRGSPTAATDTTGGYVYDDLGNHELDAHLTVDGLTYYRESNTITDFVAGVSLNLKGPTAAAVAVQIQPDPEAGVEKIKAFISAYNDVLDYLAQATAIDAKAGTRGPLALDPVIGDLKPQLRLRLAARVSGLVAGQPDSLAALGITPGADGKLSLSNETALRQKLATTPDAVAKVFGGPAGVATQLEAFVDGYAKTSGQLTIAQNQIALRVNGLTAQIDRMNDIIARRQAILEDQLARGQALLQQMARQTAQINSILGVIG